MVRQTRLSIAKFSCFCAAGALLGAVLLSGTARAGIESCGNIDVEAEAECEVVAEGGCTAQCEPINFTAACSAELYADCSGDCELELPECEVQCRGTCEAECNDLEPGEFDCEGSCKGSCEADCSGNCEAADNKAECEASCKATCSGECSGSCEGTPPSADCEAKCQGSCSGSCTGRANLECQTVCQASGYGQCKSRLEGGCKTECKEPEGALFCDGQYVDHGNNLEECVDALNAYLEAHVETSASSSGSCSGNSCSGEAEASAKATCAMSRAPASTSGGALLLAFGLLVGAAARRRH